MIANYYSKCLYMLYTYKLTVTKAFLLINGAYALCFNSVSWTNIAFVTLVNMN